MSTETMFIGLLLVMLLIVWARVETCRIVITKKLDPLFPDTNKNINKSNAKHNIKP
ncbi:hypothetical protein ES703_58633 [subsurface metagenome]